MAGRVYEADLTVPAATPAAAPVSMLWAFDQGTLVSVRIVVPSGHSGLTGIRVLWAGTPIIPFAGAGFIISDDDKMEWEINQEINAGSITVQGYNTDIYPHTFYLRGLLLGLGASQPASLVAVPAAAQPADATLAAIAAISSEGPPGAAEPAQLALPEDRTGFGLAPQLLALGGP